MRFELRFGGLARSASVWLRLALWLCLVTLAGCGLTSRPESPSELYARARASLREGRLEEAAQLTSKGQKTNASWQSRFRLLEVEVWLAEGQAAKARAALESLEVPAELEARRQVTLANACLRSGDFAAAAAALKEARSHTLEPSLALEAAVLEGLLELQQGEYARARILLEAALQDAARQHESYWEAAALTNLGFGSLRRSRFDEALPYFDRALERAGAARALRLRAILMLNSGICHYRLGDYDKARIALEEAARSAAEIGDRMHQQASVGELGNLAMLEERPREALPNYERAFGIARELQATAFVALWAGNLASAAIAAGEWDEAERWNEIARTHKNRPQDAASRAYNTLHEAAIAAGRGQVAAARDAYHRVLREASANPALVWEAHAALGALHAQAGDPSQAAHHYETALKLLEQSRSQLQRTEFKLTFLSSVIGFYRQYVEMLVRQGNADKALEVVESSRARTLLDGTPAPRSRLDYRTLARRTGNAMLSYWLAPTQSFLWVVTPTRVQRFDLPPAGDIEADVRSYRTAIQDLRDPLRNPHPAGERLFKTLVAPALPLLAGHPRITLVADGALHGLNFETLPVEGHRYWIQDVTLTVAPSIRVASRATSRRSAKAESTALLVGDPLSAGDAFPRLRHAAAELDAVKQSLQGWRTVVYQGEAAHPEAFHAAHPERFSLIHFAAHAEARADSPLNSSIILSPRHTRFKLYASDVASLPLRAGLVTISACRGAGARAYAGEGLVGLAWAFLRAGAGNVIAGLWDVDDQSTARLMEALYSHLAQHPNHDYAAALRHAKLQLLKSETNFRKPYYWGPFLLYSGAQ
jgi:CHAT domain-containing protein/Tfp pilus assembly protein PilF